MMMRCDKYFIEELQAAGYDIDFKTITDIYKQSRTKHSEAIMAGKIKHRKAEAAAYARAEEALDRLED